MGQVRVGLLQSCLLPLVWDRALHPKLSRLANGCQAQVASYFILCSMNYYETVGLRRRLAPHCDAQSVSLMIFAVTKVGHL